MKILLSLISIIFLTGCATNLPNVDTFDVKELEGGMSEIDVKNILGKPIKIHLLSIKAIIINKCLF